MTSTAAPLAERGSPASEMHVAVYALDTGAGIKVWWTSASPWVPGGDLELTTDMEDVASMTAHSLAEQILRLLRPNLQSMLADAWPPF